MRLANHSTICTMLPPNYLTRSILVPPLQHHLHIKIVITHLWHCLLLFLIGILIWNIRHLIILVIIIIALKTDSLILKLLKIIGSRLLYQFCLNLCIEAIMCLLLHWTCPLLMDKSLIEDLWENSSFCFGIFVVNAEPTSLISSNHHPKINFSSEMETSWFMLFAQSHQACSQNGLTSDVSPEITVYGTSSFRYVECHVWTI